MSMRNILLICLAMASISGCNSPISTSQAKGEWEYRVVYVLASSAQSESTVPTSISDLGSQHLTQPKQVVVSEQALNLLGAQGWELVNSYLENETVFPGLRESLAMDGLVPKPSSNVRPARLVLMFKRPKSGL
jgi:hypothetical protein